MRPTYDQLFEENKQLREENTLLKAMIKKLEERIAHLETQLNQNSKNSSKPPSSDKKANLSPPQKKENRPYHRGFSRELLPESAVTSHETRCIEICPRCRSKLMHTDHSTKWQQIELPPIKPLVHQIELVTSKCPCCHLDVRPELSEHEQFLLGPRLEGFINLLLGQYRQGHRSVRELITTILPDVVLSQGLISKIKSRMALALSTPYEHLIEKIVSANDPIYVDATGWRHQAENEHAIVLRSGSLVAYALVSHQNGQTIASLLGKRIAHLVTDRGLACGKTQIKAHQYCLAHLIRNVRGQAEHPLATCEDTEYLGELYDTLQSLFIDKHAAEKGRLSESTWRQYGYRKWQNFQEIVEELASLGSTKKLRRFCKRLLKDFVHLRVYLRNMAFPMTNNAAEEALRNLVILRKLCFGSRSLYGKKWREALNSCIETLRRQGKSVLDFLSEAISARRTGQTIPSFFS